MSQVLGQVLRASKIGSQEKNSDCMPICREKMGQPCTWMGSVDWSLYFHNRSGSMSMMDPDTFKGLGLVSTLGSNEELHHGLSIFSWKKNCNFFYFCGEKLFLRKIKYKVIFTAILSKNTIHSC